MPLNLKESPFFNFSNLALNASFCIAVFASAPCGSSSAANRSSSLPKSKSPVAPGIAGAANAKVNPGSGVTKPVSTADPI